MRIHAFALTLLVATLAPLGAAEEEGRSVSILWFGQGSEIMLSANHLEPATPVAHGGLRVLVEPGETSVTVTADEFTPDGRAPVSAQYRFTADASAVQIGPGAALGRGALCGHATLAIPAGAQVLSVWIRAASEPGCDEATSIIVPDPDPQFRYLAAERLEAGTITATFR